MAGGRHAAGKHSRDAAPERRRQQSPKLRPASSGAPFAVAGVAVVAVAAAGGLTIPEAQNASSSSTAAASVLGGTGANSSVAAQSAVAPVPLDGQITQLRTDASQLAQRASRAQQRASLAERLKRQEQLRKRLEALRPKFDLPLTSYRLTASFGQSSNLWQHNHTGQDFAAPIGTPIHAVADGVIVSAGWAGAYGWRTIIRLKDGTENWYCHQSHFVRRSGFVKAGTLIGLVGATGNVTGPHLHLEVRINNVPINPMPWLRAHGLNP